MYCILVCGYSPGALRHFSKGWSGHIRQGIRGRDKKLEVRSQEKDEEKDVTTKGQEEF